MVMWLVTLVVAVVIAAHFIFDLWLDRRQIHHVIAHRDAVPAPFAGSIDLADHQKAADYTVASKRLGLWSGAASFVLLVVLVFGGGFSALQEKVFSLTGNGYLGSLALTFALGAITTLVSLPFSYYRIFVIEQRFGFNRMSRKLFFADLVKSLVLAVVLLTPLILALDYVLREFRSNWWLLGWSIWVIFSLLTLLIVPTFILPLFNKFVPLDQADLKQRINTLVERCGFRSKGVFKMDGSKRSSHSNAFFTGLGASKRIVIFDTLMEQLGPDEIEAVLAHELGHFKLRHILKRLVVSIAISFVVFALLGWLAEMPWFYAAFGIEISTAQASPFVAILLFALVFPSFSYWFGFASNHLSRRHEFEADAFAARYAKASSLAAALVKLHRDNASTLTPDPLYVLFNHSHPTVGQRISRLLGSTPQSATG